MGGVSVVWAEIGAGVLMSEVPEMIRESAVKVRLRLGTVPFLLIQ